MNYILKDFVSTKVYENLKGLEKEYFQADNKKYRYPVVLSGLVGVSKAMLGSALNIDNKEKVVIVTYNELQARDLLKNILYFTDDVDFFPKREISIYDYDAESNEIEFDRITVLNKIHKNKAKIIVTTIEALMQNLVAEDSLYENSINLKVGDEVDIEKIKQTLISLGYERADLTEARGQFSIRGDIVDISQSETVGVRLELWGDTIDSIRQFNLQNQRSIENIDKCEILPMSEKIIDSPLSVVADRIEQAVAHGVLISTENTNKDVEEIRNGDYRNKIDRYFDKFYLNQSNLLDYLKGFKILVDEPEKIKQRIESIQLDNENLIKELIEKGKAVPDILYSENKYIYNFEKYDNVVYIKEADSKLNSFKYKENNSFNSENLKGLNDEIVQDLKAKRKVIVLTGSVEGQSKVAKIIENSVKVESLDGLKLNTSSVFVCTGSLTTGFVNEETGLVVLSNDEFFSTRKKRPRSSLKSFNEGSKIVFADLNVNDFVVHRKYGIGVFTGVKTIEVDGVTKDFIGIKYRGGDALYVPTTNLDNVRKYIGGEGSIKLNKLGTKEWAETKAKVKGNLRSVAKELIELYARRENSKGFAFSEDTPWQKEFEDSFPYTETDDQLRCIEEVKHDMQNSKPMDRLLCGDVGYGKTEVALRAAFKAVMDGKQVAYLAPTTILANQQYEEFVERMQAYPIRIELLNRFRTAKQQKETVEKLKRGEVDVVIGTHRLLSNDVEFKDLGLLIVDEEHRFGVKAKEKIKEYKATVDVLTMTATPIPRTLQMSIVGIRDMSVIYEPPMNRKPVQTYVLEYDREVVREAITKELERGGQVFYIFNNVENMPNKAQEIADMIPEAKVDFANGQMTGNQIEEIMQNFIDNKTNVLVCTTILESGIDIPNANTIIVENADRFGLAQLYQIRGRVGRSNRQAYAYITYRKDKMMNEDASARLKAIKEFTEFGSGFKIATRDLQIRGAGSLFGEIQSGHMEQVGYDMYNRLLQEVVKEMKGEKFEEEPEEEITIDINLSAYIPESYIENASQKIEVYQDIANCKSEEDIKNVVDEIKDRYGALPSEVENLLEIARIKNLCREKKIVKIQQKGSNIIFILSAFNNDKAVDLIKRYGHQIRFSPGITPYLTLKPDGKDLIAEIKEFIDII